MNERTRRSTVTFSHPFHLPSVGYELAAGSYEIEIDEALIADLSFSAYHRVSSRIILPYTIGNMTLRQTMVVETKELDAALEADRQVH